MSKVFLMMLLAVVNSSAMAGWEPAMYNKGNTKVTYVDASTILKAGNNVKMWSLTDFETADYVGKKRYMSQKDHREYDCKVGQMRSLSASIYSGNMGKGEVVDSYSGPSEWMPVPPRSVGEALWKIACGIIVPH